MSRLNVVGPPLLFCLLGIGLWVALLARNRKFTLSFRHIAAVALAVGLVCRVILACTMATFDAPDEQAHFHYIQYLHDQQAFPVQTTDVNSPTNTFEYYQPPLYYLIAVPLYSLSQDVLHADVATTVRVLRLFSVVLWVANFLLVVLLLQRLKITDGFVTTFVIGMISLLPSYMVVSSAINNDNLLFPLGAWLLVLATQEPTPRRAAGLGLLLALILYTKLSGAVYGILIGALLFHLVLKKRLALSNALLDFGIMLLLAGLLWAPWGARNLHLYGSLTAENIGFLRARWPSLTTALTQSALLMMHTFWAVSGMLNNHWFISPLGLALSLLGLVAVGYGLLARKSVLSQSLTEDPTGLLFGATIALGFNVLLALRMGALYAQAQGRYLYPLLIPLALLMALGLRSLTEKVRLHNVALSVLCVWALYALTFTGYNVGVVNYHRAASDQPASEARYIDKSR